MATAKATSVVLNHNYRNTITRIILNTRSDTSTDSRQEKKRYRIIVCSASSIKRYLLYDIYDVRRLLFLISCFFFFWCCTEGVGYDYEKFDRIFRAVLMECRYNCVPIELYEYSTDSIIYLLNDTNDTGSIVFFEYYYWQKDTIVFELIYMDTDQSCS